MRISTARKWAYKRCGVQFPEYWRAAVLRDLNVLIHMVDSWKLWWKARHTRVEDVAALARKTIYEQRAQLDTAIDVLAQTKSELETYKKNAAEHKELRVKYARLRRERYLASGASGEMPGKHT